MKPIQITHTEWNFKPLFDGDNDPRFEAGQKEVWEKNEAFAKKWMDRDDYLKDPASLAEAMDEYEALQRTAGAEWDGMFYITLRAEQDQNDPSVKAKYNKLQDFANKIVNETQFFNLRVQKIDPALQKDFLEYPGLQKYRHVLEMMFAEAKYSLSEPEEKILNLKGAPAHSNWVKMTSGFLAKEEREVLEEGGSKAKKSFAEILGLLEHLQKPVRDSAAAAFNDILARHADVAEAEINSILADKKTDDELRGASRPDLMRHISDDIESEVVDAMLEAVQKGNGIAQRYYALKAKLFGVPALEYHERNVPYGKTDKEYAFEEAVSLAHNVFTDLDQDFADILKSFLDNGQIDVYPRKGKDTGAFCAHGLLKHPIFVLLNHTGRLRDVQTLAHEMGHAINDVYMQRAQNELTYGTSLAIAEVSSTFMEDFIVDEIMKSADDELRLSLMMSRIGNDVSTIFRQVACYRFEQELHETFREKGYLSKEDIGAIFQKHMKSYMGDAVIQSPGSQNWWVYWGHIRNFFYVYSYASGLLISKAMQASVKKDKSFIGKVKEFLSAGRSDSPKNIFKKMGIDITRPEFWQEGLAEIEKNLAETEALAKKLGKLSHP